MKSFFLQQIEKALNRYLQLDPESSKRLQGLEGKTISIELLVLNLSFQMSIQDNEIKISTGQALMSEIKIRGTPINLLALALAQDKKSHFFTHSVFIEGNAELGQQIIELFNQIEIDWEEYLSHAIGDIPAHEIGRFTKNTLAWGKKAKKSLVQNITDYIHEEKLWLAPKTGLEDFFSDIDELRLDLDRLEARVKQLQN